jgi:hypothetical protein
MSTMPPDQPGSTPPPPPPSSHQTGTPTIGQGGYGGFGRVPTTGAILPVPGNAEFLVYFLATIFLVVIWAASDQLEAHGFAILFTILTVGYILSRGIAKASRVLEQ